MGGRWEHYFAFPGILWSLPFPAAKPYVVLVFSKFNGTGLPFQLRFTFHFILFRQWYHLSQIYFCNPCYIPQPWVHSNGGTDLRYCSATSGWQWKTKGLWVTQEHQGEGKQRGNILNHHKTRGFPLGTRYTQRAHQLSYFNRNTFSQAVFNLVSCDAYPDITANSTSRKKRMMTTTTTKPTLVLVGRKTGSNHSKVKEDWKSSWHHFICIEWTSFRYVIWNTNHHHPSHHEDPV